MKNKDFKAFMVSGEAIDAADRSHRFTEYTSAVTPHKALANIKHRLGHKNLYRDITVAQVDLPSSPRPARSCSQLSLFN